jgi:hypothetical protein
VRRDGRWPRGWFGRSLAHAGDSYGRSSVSNTEEDRGASVWAATSFWIQAFTFFEVLDWEVGGETRLDVVGVAVSMPFVTTVEGSGWVSLKHRSSYFFSGFREGQTFLNPKLLDGLLLEKKRAFF